MKALPKDVITHKGLLFRLVNLPEADLLAQSYGMPYAERMVKALEAQHQSMKFSVQELRPEVLAFALLMEARLREKDADKGDSWKGQSPANLEVHATSKMRMIERTCDDHEAAGHAVDLANYCMMIADVAGGLQIEDGGPGWAGVDEDQPLEIPAFLRMHRIDPHN